MIKQENKADGWILQEYLDLLKKGQSVYIYPDWRHLDDDPCARLMRINIITSSQKDRWEKLEEWAKDAALRFSWLLSDGTSDDASIRLILARLDNLPKAERE